MAGEPKTKSKPAAIPAFTTVQVETMLRAAGAHEPWAQPEGCASLADLLTSIAQEAARPAPDGIYLAMARRARDASAELQRTIQVMLPIYERTPQAGDLTALLEWDYERAKKLRALSAALDALEGEPLPIPFRNKKPNALLKLAMPGAGRRRRPAYARWASWASILFREYRETVGSGSRTRNGPAARFIADALNQVGFSGFGPVNTNATDPMLQRKRGKKPITPGAVEGALSRPA